MKVYAKYAKELEKEIYELYKKDPYNWHVFVSKDKDLNPIFYILNTKIDCLWKLVYEPHVRYGVRIEDVDIQSFSDLKKFFQSQECLNFGVRELPESLEKRIFKEIKEFGEISKRTLEEILTLPLEEGIVDKGVIGPFIYFSSPFFQLLDEESQRFLDEIRRKRFTYSL
jgi:hypothetical protein